MTDPWKQLTALRERRLLVASQAATQAALAAARQRQEVERCVVDAGRAVDAKQAHQQEVQRPDAGGGIPAARLQEAAGWRRVLAEAIVAADLATAAASERAQAGEAEAGEARRAAARAAARRDAANKSAERERAAARARQERLDELRAESVGRQRWQVGHAREE